jgi:hypothetical protein
MNIYIAGEGEVDSMLKPIKLEKIMDLSKLAIKLSNNTRECILCQGSSCITPSTCCDPGHCPKLFCC